MSESELARNPVEELADDFLRRLRCGEHPSISEYAQNHPELADEIRDVFPTLALMEQAGCAEKGEALCDVVIGATAPPTTLGEYEILREVGRGGMGIVYEAVQQSLGRHVALKVLSRPAAQNAVRLERFRREARSAARLHHTNIVPVFDVGSCEGSYFYAMQFIQGDSLDAVLAELVRLRGGGVTKEDSLATRNLATALATGQFDASGAEPLPSKTASFANASPSPATMAMASEARMRRAEGSCHAAIPASIGSSDFASQSDAHFYRSVARIGLQVAEALAYAHEQGVLHRDIKPANLLLDHQGNVWVADFGLAKDDEEALTEAGDLVGTLRYMAPERFDGMSDARSDLYGLGTTLYELIALRPAFCDSDRGRLIKRISEDTPARLSVYDRRVPLDLDTIVMKCVARRRDERYASAAALADDLRRFLSDRPIKARPATSLEKVWRWCRRNPAIASLTAAVWTLLAAIAVGASLSSFWLTQEQGETKRQLLRTGEAEERAEQRLFDALVAQARATRRSRLPGQRFDSLVALAEAVKLDPDKRLDDVTLRTLRSEVMAASTLPDVRRIKSFTFASPWIGAAAVDCDAERYAVCASAGGLQVFSVKDFREVCSLSAVGMCSEPRFAPDGRTLLAEIYNQGKASLALWSFDRSEAPPLVVQEGPFITVAFSADGRRLAVATDDGAIHIWNVDEKRRVRQLGPVPLPRHLAFRPDGKQIALASEEPRGVQIYDLETGQLAKSWPQDDAGRHIAWRGDGRLLAASADDCQIYVWDTWSERLVSRLHGHLVGMTRLWFSEDGTALISTAWDGTTRLWNPVTGRELMKMPGASGEGRHHDRLVFAHGWTPSAKVEAAEIWEFVPAPELKTLHHGLVGNQNRARGWVYCASCSRDGQLVATSSNDGVRLWDLRRSTDIAHLPMVSGASVSLFNPERNEMVTYSSAGVWLWPYSADPECPEKVRLGPPSRLIQGEFFGEAAGSYSADGSCLIVAEPGLQQATVLRLGDPIQRVALGPHPAVRQVAVSPDGRWAATAPWRGFSIKIWDTTTGEQVGDEIPCLDGWVRFSPDGQWLATADEAGFRLWNVANWKPGPAIRCSSHGTMAFSPDSRVLAVTNGQDAQIRFLNVSDGEELASLESPDAANFYFLNYSPDGSRLFAATLANTVHIWNLRLLREKLASLGLDWQQPNYSPEPTDGGPLEVDVDWGTFPRGSSAP